MITDWHKKRDSFDQGIMPGLAHELWGADPASLRWIGQDYNIVFRFEAGGSGYYLRICHTSLHTLSEARQVMRFLRFLAGENVPVGEPIPSVNGKYIELLDGGYFAAAQKEAPGQIMEAFMLDRSVYQAWGKSLGMLHAASRRYQPDPTSEYAFPRVQQFWRNIAPTVRSAPAEVRRVYEELTEYVAGLPLRDYGLIHGDYRPGNVIWDGKTARAIDFDEPNYHWYIADVCRALLELWGQPADERRKFRQSFMRGYLSEHQIDEWWVSQLPYFAQHRALLMYAWDVQEGGNWGEAVKWVVQRVEW